MVSVHFKNRHPFPPCYHKYEMGEDTNKKGRRYFQIINKMEKTTKSKPCQKQNLENIASLCPLEEGGA